MSPWREKGHRKGWNAFGEIVGREWRVGWGSGKMKNVFFLSKSFVFGEKNIDQVSNYYQKMASKIHSISNSFPFKCF